MIQQRIWQKYLYGVRLEIIRIVSRSRKLTMMLLRFTGFVFVNWLIRVSGFRSNTLFRFNNIGKGRTYCDTADSIGADVTEVGIEEYLGPTSDFDDMEAGCSIADLGATNYLPSFLPCIIFLPLLSYFISAISSSMSVMLWCFSRYSSYGRTITDWRRERPLHKHSGKRETSNLRRNTKQLQI